MVVEWHEQAAAGPQARATNQSLFHVLAFPQMCLLGAQADKLQNALSRCSVDPRATDVSRLMKQLDVGHNRYGVVLFAWMASCSLHPRPHICRMPDHAVMDEPPRLAGLFSCQLTVACHPGETCRRGSATRTSLRLRWTRSASCQHSRLQKSFSALDQACTNPAVSMVAIPCFPLLAAYRSTSARNSSHRTFAIGW
jgi:hypothetical protein